ncbi:MAG TPA: hypothetical protein VNA04_03710 [Thermoanaerobaculia bacterium]|nr:hypothetical protein [Thermoanaerobaculia bacterium]
MMSPAGMALAAITVMLWLLWSDSIRARKPAPLLYAIRVALFLVVSGVLILNLVRYPAFFTGTTRVLVLLAVLIGLLGAVYFGKRLARRA